MKKLLTIGMVLICSAGISSIAYGSIEGSAHDLSAEGGGPICLPCHAPHGGVTDPSAPLWNHALSDLSGVAGGAYTLYESTTLDASISQPLGVSKLCLSCHDGTTAVDSFSGDTGNTMIDTYGDGMEIGTDLSDDHPISFDYTTLLATTDGGLHDPSTTTALIVASGDTYTAGTITDDMLFGNSMECASCHDVHNKYGIGKLLVKSNANSALCLTCHDK